MTRTLRSCVGTILVLFVAAAVPVRGAEEKPQPYIVLVGIDNYADTQIKARTHAEADAKAFYDLFSSRDFLGADAGHIKLLLGKPDEKRNSEPATHDNILKAVRWLSSKAGKDDVAIFAFFGEGAPIGERVCYFGSDSTYADRAKNAISAADFEQEFEKLKSKKFCAFVDVNFKGFDAGKQPTPEINLANLYKEYLGKEKEDETATVGRIVFLANIGWKPALELENHGLLAQIVLDALNGKADNEGYEPDGVVTIDELIKYLEKEAVQLVRKNAKNKEEREQIPMILGGRDSHFVLTHNPPVYTKVEETLKKFDQIAQDKKLASELVDEGRSFLSRMPKLEAQRALRKDYQKLVAGELTVEDFNKDRTKILDGLKFKRADALAFAAKLIHATQQVREGYVKNLNQGELVAWAIRGLYQRVDEKMPADVKERLDKIKEMKEPELTVLVADVREKLGSREDLDKHKDIDFALQFMLSHLDPYTTYIDPETLDRFSQETDASFTGIGIQIRKDTVKDMLLVVTPIKGSPAYKAGIKAGDVITKITREMDSKGNKLDTPEVISTKGLAIADAVKKILGREKTKVKLTVEREGEPKPLEFEVTRDRIEVETVLGTKRKEDDSWDYVIDHQNRICYVRLTQFAQNTARDLVEVIDKLEQKFKLDKKDIQGFILDLRNNPGGLLTSAVIISDLFIDDGMIVSIRPRVGRELPYYGEHEKSFTKFPMVVLVNGGSASGSEIVAACLQDHNRAIIMGERSYGKGSVQNIQNFEGGKLKMTTASYWRPSGKNMNRTSTGGKDEDEWGVMPDQGFAMKYSVKESEQLADHQHELEVIPRRDLPPAKEKKPEFKDRQLQMALDYLRSQIKMASREQAKKSN